MPLKPLVKLARFGSTFELSRFSKPYISSRRDPFYFRRKKSKSTFKLMQNVMRTKRNIRRTITTLTHTLGKPTFATFTYAKPQHNMQEAIEDWRTFTRKMKVSFPGIAFIRVPERHKSGAVHFHAVLFGLPEHLACNMKKMRGRWIHGCKNNAPCERRLRSLAKVWDRGFVDLQQVRSERAIGSYIAKYLTKGEPDWTLFGNHIASCNRTYYDRLNEARKSGQLWELSSSSSPTATQFAMEDMLGQATLERENTFPTRWLGDCRFSVFRVDT